ncbi:hypothetical protein E6O75_ATG00535 [Venturia nashicola]|uniref:Uncharacterized protein n=1 Tax=Venturia nashicola TaxID=86259 RepID=A0A4Z1PTZ1_9PEZI|nr:hypothetical protein E6O75_ATG00535 [Venturia nashicola]
MKSSFNSKAIFATLACITFLTKAAPADTPLVITLCNDVNYGKCEVVKVYRYHCNPLDKATMAVSPIQHSRTPMFLGADCLRGLSVTLTREAIFGSFRIIQT